MWKDWRTAGALHRSVWTLDLRSAGFFYCRFDFRPPHCRAANLGKWLIFTPMCMPSACEITTACIVL